MHTTLKSVDQGYKLHGNIWYVISSKNVSLHYITHQYILCLECHIILSDNFIASQLLSANNLGHGGTLQDGLTEIPEDINILILL